MPSAMFVLSVCDVLVTLKNLIKGSISKDGNWIDASLSSIIQIEKLSFSKIDSNFLIVVLARSERTWLQKHSFTEEDRVTESNESLVQLSEVRDGGVSTLVEIMWWPVPGVRYISLATRDKSPWPLIGPLAARLASDWLMPSPGRSYQWQSLQHHKTITLLHILMVTKTQQMVRCHPGLTRLQTHQQRMQYKDFSRATSSFQDEWNDVKTPETTQKQVWASPGVLPGDHNHLICLSDKNMKLLSIPYKRRWNKESGDVPLKLWWQKAANGAIYQYWESRALVSGRWVASDKYDIILMASPLFMALHLL